MTQALWTAVAAASVLALVGAVLIVVYAARRGREQDAARGLSRPNTKKLKTSKRKRWNFIIAAYLLMCAAFAVIVLFQSGQPNRDALDCMAIPIGAVFFLIAAFTFRGRAVRRECATVQTMATFVEQERVSSDSGHKSYFSILEFSAERFTRRVRYAGRPDQKIGAQIAILYAPEDPGVLYVPEIEQKRGRFFFVILMFYGILFPLAALLAPVLRTFPIH